MKYNDPEHEELYHKLMDELSKTDDPVKIEALAKIMRSKLTSIIASAQMLADDLDDVDDQAAEQRDLAQIIVESARSIAVMLDAARDAEDSEDQPPEEDDLPHN